MRFLLVLQPVWFWGYCRHMRAFITLLVLSTVGCTASGTFGSSTKAPQRTSEGPLSPPGQPDGDTGGSGDTGDTGGPPPIEIDCSDLPSEPIEETVIEGARGYHGLAFDGEGRIVGWDGRSGLVGARSDGSAELLVPGIESAEQMVRLDDGRLFLVDQNEGGVDVITPDGSRSAFVRGLNGEYPYGMALGPDGKLYVVDGNIYRLDPDTAELTVVWTNSFRWELPHTVGFSLDSRTMFIAMIGEGDMYAVELDENLDFVGEPEPYVFLRGGWQDTITVDACGNIYVAEYFTSRVYRVTPDGDDEIFHDPRERGYPHGFSWGTGQDGWDENTLYAPHPYDGNTVRGYDIGVPDGRLVREWNGVRVGR